MSKDPDTHVVITDYDLGDMSGIELGKRIQERGFEAHVVLYLANFGNVIRDTHHVVMTAVERGGIDHDQRLLSTVAVLLGA